MRVRIYYEDTDCGGIVYHTNYIKYCERARSEAFFEHGRDGFFLDGGFVVSSLEAKFIATAKLGDILDIKTKVLEIRRASTLLEQEIYLIAHAQDGKLKNPAKLVFSIRVKLAFLDMTKARLSKIPDKFIKILEGLK